MQTTVHIKLNTHPEPKNALIQTMRVCNYAADKISKVAFETKEFRKFPLQKLVYHTLKAKTGLNANHVIRAISKVVQSYKLDRKVCRCFRPQGAIELDKDLVTWKVEEQIVSVNTLSGRLHLSFVCAPWQKELLQGKKGQSDLIYRDNEFYLNVPVQVEEAPLFQPEGAIGVDLGIVQIATDSEGNQYSGEPIRKARKKCARLRKLLQPKKSRSAIKHLQKARKRESRFVRDVNHCISKKLVQLALLRQKALALESLKGIRGRGNGYNRAMRTELNSWAFHQLKLFVAYKCQRAGVTLIEVDPRYSSQTCSGCGHCEKGNRKSQERFECLCCGLKLNADINAALNLKARAELSSCLMFRKETPVSKQGQAAPFRGR
jgi:putative transposase